MTADGDVRSVKLSIPAKPEYISLGRLALTGLARLRTLPEETLGDLKLALTEACSNSVRHAYPGGGGIVEISYQLFPDRFVFEVLDSGPGFELNGAPEEEEDNLTEGGLGIAIIRALADELEIHGREDAQGSRLRFVKFLPS